MENTSPTLLAHANNLSQYAMAAAMANEKLVTEALETAEFLRYIVDLVRRGKLEEALWHLRSTSGAEEQPLEQTPYVTQRNSDTLKRGKPSDISFFLLCFAAYICRYTTLATAQSNQWNKTSPRPMASSFLVPNNCGKWSIRNYAEP